MVLEEDQPGLVYLLHLRHFFTQLVPFARMSPAPQIVRPGEYGRGFRPLALATEERDVIAVYMPTGGTATLRLPRGGRYHAQWFDPRTGELSSAALSKRKGYRVQAPGGADRHGHPWDWVLLLRVVPL
jgi:hypothetical protein